MREDSIIDAKCEVNKGTSAPDTFLSIAGISHDENSWSDIYAYFLSKSRLGRIFLNSLLHIISLKTNRSLKIEEYRVERETVTNQGNRIDLLIKSKSHSIIIENKVHHILNNDLEDYWLSVPGVDNAKTGIILTLSHIITNHPNYINITHNEWISEIRKQLNDKTFNLLNNEKVIFDDFCRNIMKESKELDPEISKHYLKNRDRINELVNEASDIKEWLMRVFNDKKFIHSLNCVTLVHEDYVNSKYRYVMYKLPQTEELVITIFYEYMWNSKPGDARLIFYIQPLGKWFKKAESIEDKINKIVIEEGIEYNYTHTKHYWHCGGVECRFSEDKILDEEYIKKCIEEHIVNPDSKLMKTAKRIAEKLSLIHLPSYSWEDALTYLKQMQANVGGEDFANWLVNQFRFVLYDRTHQIVILEVRDQRTKDRFEKFINEDLMLALKYTFGDNVRCSIICQNIKPIGTDVAN